MNFRFHVIRTVFFSLFLIWVFPSCGQNGIYSIQNSKLRLDFDFAKKIFIVNDRISNREWESLPMENISVKEVKNLSSEELQLNLFDSVANLNFSSTVKINADRITFTVSMPDNAIASGESTEATSLSLNNSTDNSSGFSGISFPPAIKTNYNQGEIVLSIRSCGTLVKQSDMGFPMKNIMVYDNLGHDMPWVGVFDSLKRDGFMVLAETPFNASINLLNEGDILWPQIKWHQSMQKWLYPRKVSYVFSQTGGYVGLAKLYRTQLEKEGALNTFSQKLKDRPKVNLLKGAVLVWGSDGLRFAKEAHAAGVKRAIVYGRFPALSLKNIEELGFITSEYENIMDCKEGQTGFMKDSKANTVIIDSKGNPVQGWTDEYFVRSSVKSLEAVKNYMPQLLKQFPYTGRFIDVGPADLREDYHPGHTFGREQDAGYKRGVAEYFANDLRLVVGGEHGKSWSANVLDYTEGATSGSFWWEEGNKPGHLIKPKDLNYMSQNFATYGNNYRTRIPLWSLVYHDCHSTSWYWGDTNDWFYEVSPEISDQKDITDILYGTMPMCWADKKGYGWDRNRSRFLQTVRNVCNFQHEIAFEEMLNHKFLNESRTLQRTSFKNGAYAIVNFDKIPQSYKQGDKEILLAPFGFYAVAPGFFQSKLIENEQVVTRIESKEFVSVETPLKRVKGNIEAKGRITVFEVAPGKWHVLAETQDEESMVNLQKIADLERPGSCSLSELNDAGEQIKEISKSMSANKIVIPPGNGQLKLYGINIINE